MAGLWLGLPALPAARAGEPCHYNWVQIPNLPGWFAFGAAINSHGHVTGGLLSGGDYTRAFVWTPETGTVEIPRPPGAIGMSAVDINDHGVVVGQLQQPGVQPGYLWDGQTMTLIPMPDWANVCLPYAINNQGQVVGMVQNFITGPTLGFLFDEGTFSLIGQESQRPVDVNELGELVGYATFPGGYTHACQFVGNNVEFFPEPEGTVRSKVGKANNNGMVAGWVSPKPRNYDGAVWEPDRTRIVLTDGDMAWLEFLSINDAGRVVGVARRDSGDIGRGVVWQEDNLRDLNELAEPPSSIIAALDINNRGEIVVELRLSGLLPRSGVLYPVWLPGDLTGDCAVTIDDLVIVLSNFGSPQETFPRGDVDMDGDVDLPDLAILLANWGP